MPAVATRARVTPEDLLNMPDANGYELVNGELVEKNVSMLSSHVGAEIIGLLREYTKKTGSGLAFANDLGYQCFTDDPTKVRKPDASYITKDRLTAEQLTDGFSQIAPDLAVEVLSPNDYIYDVDKKVTEYLNAGVRAVWIVNPDTKVIKVERPGRNTEKVHIGEDLVDEEILPGFRCPAEEIFAGAARVSSKE